MSEKSQRCPVQYERDQSGCMWGFVSIFDFRQARSTQKLISDRRRGSRHAVVAGSTKNKFDGNCEGTLKMEKNVTKAHDAGKTSVKKLMEEEMVGEQGPKEEIKRSEVEPKESISEHGSHKRKNRRKTNRVRSKSCDAQIEVVTQNLKSDRSHIHNSEKVSARSLDLDEIMEEFCQQIHQKSVCLKHDLNGEVQAHPNRKNPDFEEKLSEAIKLFVHQKLINGKHVTEDEDTRSSKELKDALQALSSDEELFLKLLQDPKPVMVKCVQNLQNIQGEKDEDCKQLVGSNILEHHFPDITKTDESIYSKQHKFFKRKAKSVEKNQPKDIKASEASKRIVVLRPGPTDFQNTETESNHCSSPESHLVIRNKEANDRVGSYFLISEIKRRWKNAMGKERRLISDNRPSKRFPSKQQALGNSDRGFKENAGRTSPIKDHFYIEKVAKSPIGVKKGGKVRKPRECEISEQLESPHYPEQRVRKHLSEMLSNEHEDVDFSSTQIPKILGRIVSLSEDDSPIGSPGRDWEQSFVTAQMRFSAKDKFHEQENNVSHLNRTIVNLEAQSCISDDNTDDRGEATPNNSCVPSEVIHDNMVETTFCSIEEEILSEGDMALVKANDIVVQEDSSNILDTPFEPDQSFITRGEQNDVSDDSDGKEYSACVKDDSNRENLSPSSPLISLPISSVNMKPEDLDCVMEISERPSPVSVLEPLSIEEDIIPTSVRSHLVELRMQPIRIQFEEHDPSAADQHAHLKTGIEYKESTAEYVKVVLQASGMNWDEFYMRSHFSNQFVDPSISDEVEFFPNKLCCDKNLLFDCINEVLMELYGRYMGSYPGVSYTNCTIRPIPNMKNAIYEVLEGVYWHLLPLPLPSTLDQIVKKDMTKTGAWMDIQFDAATIILEIGEAIFEDLVDDTIISCKSGKVGSESSLIPIDLKEQE